MSDSIKSVITYYISVQIFSFWVSFLEVWEIFDLLPPLTPRVPENGSVIIYFHLLSSYHFTGNDKFLIKNRWETNLSKIILKILVLDLSNKRFIHTWGPICSLDADLKIISKSISDKLKRFYHIWYSHNKQSMLKTICCWNRKINIWYYRIC